MNALNRRFGNRPPLFMAVLLTASLAILSLTDLAPAQTGPTKVPDAKAPPIVKDSEVKGQGGKQRPITHKDYENWRSIQTPLISPNGQYVAYTLSSADGSELIVADLVGKKEYRQARGKAGGGAGGKGGAGGGGVSATTGRDCNAAGGCTRAGAPEPRTACLGGTTAGARTTAGAVATSLSST